MALLVLVRLPHTLAIQGLLAALGWHWLGWLRPLRSPPCASPTSLAAMLGVKAEAQRKVGTCKHIFKPLLWSRLLMVYC